MRPHKIFNIFIPTSINVNHKGSVMTYKYLFLLYYNTYYIIPIKFTNRLPTGRTFDKINWKKPPAGRKFHKIYDKTLIK